MTHKSLWNKGTYSQPGQSPGTGKDKENVWTQLCLSNPATLDVNHPFYSEAVEQRSGLCVRSPDGQEIL